ncbi:aerobic ribonucleoside-diphosphate reductase Ia, B2 protein subunit NrdB [Campylobacter pinnipediorum subsp. caledonicus]|uniref:Ribonucleoside-diphosphate reductase subunit beta n=1 Tax=Campylobacter pinnipediorum subsp. caledonicus TaxID=1874362 RepID=A0A1S6U9G7_9BACT|nr:ribonucleotide-diphosphate reductase subunit beta [Campylobacter pinnipediorum]AQW86730.1 aerobic ribonucleoside-diphosphate reductase Ia, B2 protein subunit NrdB [Campylobacter pinnipediorum subsp. caledonicus]AQW88381.1 aerobic ribonucleoside-diphosphate reductase Ia, B2 protein subunit NrdB [Campylobacter pinnipediorum subsp. caledonicus]OPA72650.1 ribonucleotide-diphosphate reductase subunit beta [Campylobacter pinnipediorum subsp. caledonicus]
MERKKIYNPKSNETLTDRRVFNGNPHGILNFTKAKYQWALKLWDLMEANTWFPKEVDVSADVRDYNYNLTQAERRMYDLVWSQLISMDSFQTNNLADNINPYITAPEINACLARQAYEEANHSKSYAVMVEAISDNTDLIYEMEKHDDVLREKNDYISGLYEELAGEVTDVKLLLAMVANQILEGIYFYSGFTAIYALARAGKMLGSAQMIRFIQRDEITHLLLFQNMINSVRNERPELFTAEVEETIYDMFKKAGDLEIKWGKYITQNQIMGFTDDIIQEYIHYLVDQRLVAIGLKRIYNAKHPIKWVDDFSKFNDQKSNFFESKVTNYSKGSLSFDDF